MTIHIFGAGISGLSAAHHLLDTGYPVVLYESLGVIGGFARSRREANGMPTEHSWRGYSPAYKNTFDIMKRIPTDVGTVYDTLSVPIKFLSPHNNMTNRGIDPKSTLWDNVVSGYYIVKCLTSCKRREVYAQQSFKDAIKNKVSKAGYDNYIKSIGPGLGLSQDLASIYHITKYAEMELTTGSHEHKNYTHKGGQGWHVLTAPTSEAWFDPWIDYLKNKGLDLRLNTELKKINVEEGKVVQCSVNDENIGSPGDTFVFCINPFKFKDILENSGLLSPKYPQLNKFIGLTQAGSHAQPSFRLLFNRKINLPKKNTCFTFPDSEFNITLYPQDNFFDNDSYINNVTLWSGAVCEAYTPGPLFNKPAIELNRDELLQEIQYQIFRSDELKTYIEQHNNFIYEDLKVIKSEIWYEWIFSNGDPQTTNPKWVNTLNTYKYRPETITNIPNLLLGGAHCNTTIDIWSMEGAVESGKAAAEKIIGGLVVQQIGDLPQSNIVQKHESPRYLAPFQVMDDLLYFVRLPQLVDVLLILLIIILVIIVAKVSLYIYANIYDKYDSFTIQQKN